MSGVCSTYLLCMELLKCSGIFHIQTASGITIQPNPPYCISTGPVHRMPMTGNYSVHKQFVDSSSSLCVSSSSAADLVIISSPSAPKEMDLEQDDQQELTS